MEVLIIVVCCIVAIFGKVQKAARIEEKQNAPQSELDEWAQLNGLTVYRTTPGILRAIEDSPHEILVTGEREGRRFSVRLGNTNHVVEVHLNRPLPRIALSGLFGVGGSPLGAQSFATDFRQGSSVPSAIQSVRNYSISSMLKADQVLATIDLLRPKRLSIGDGTLLLERRGALRTEQVLGYLDDVVQLAGSLEAEFGAHWVRVAQQRGWESRQTDTSWTMSGRDEVAEYKADYLCGDPGSMLILARPLDEAAWPSGLSLEKRSKRGNKIQTGNPVLDSQVDIRAYDAASLTKPLQDLDLANAIMAVLLGHGGWLLNGQIHIRDYTGEVDVERAIDDLVDLSHRLTRLG